jgi:hypothetical protein
MVLCTWKEKTYKQSVQEVLLIFQKFITNYAKEKHADRCKLIFNLKSVYVLYSISTGNFLVTLLTSSQ